jgi:hypothetical protein
VSAAVGGIVGGVLGGASYSLSHPHDFSWSGLGTGIDASHGFMQKYSTWLGTAGIVLGGAATADACFSQQWGSCTAGAISLGMAGIGYGASRMAASALREAVGAPYSRELV